MNSTFLKLVLVLLAVGIIISYVQPAWQDIDTQQDQIDEINTAISNANRNNDELRRLNNLKESLSQQSKIDLDIFLPRAIDPLQVMADITTIGSLSRVDVSAISSGEAVEIEAGTILQSGEESMALSMQDFSVVVSGSYESFKTFLRNVERNKYLLEVVSLDFSGEEAEQEEGDDSDDNDEQAAGESTYALTLRAYAFPNPVTSQESDS